MLDDAPCRHGEVDDDTTRHGLFIRLPVIWHVVLLNAHARYRSAAHPHRAAHAVHHYELARAARLWEHTSRNALLSPILCCPNPARCGAPRAMGGESSTHKFPTSKAILCTLKGLKVCDRVHVHVSRRLKKVCHLDVISGISATERGFVNQLCMHAPPDSEKTKSNCHPPHIHQALPS